jgi:F1F0 ATPase subunit 2
MTDPTLAFAGRLAVGLIAGLLAGALHFGSLWWNSRLLMTGGAAKAVAFQLVRFTIAAAVLTTLATLGAPSLLAGALGFLLARHLSLRAFGEPT